jgi:flagellar hook protein FlgE
VVNSAAKPGDIRMPLGSTIPPEATTKVTLKGNLSTDATPDMNNPDNTGVKDTPPGAPGYITTIPIKVYDDQGATHTVTAEFTRTANDNAAGTSGWQVRLLDESNALIPAGAGVTNPVNLSFAGGKATGLDASGQIEIGGYMVDMSDVNSYAGNTDARVFDTDGQAAGALTSLSYTVSDSGEIIGVYSNGLKQTLGQVAMATFKNVAGLEKVGNSMFRTTVNSGYAQVGEPGSPGMGQVISGALEMSNVDLAQEFTNLVVAQRGFQANSRVISSSDELLQDLVNLKR